MIVDLQEYKNNKEKLETRIITEEENYEILIELNMLKRIQERKAFFLKKTLKLVK